MKTKLWFMITTIIQTGYFIAIGLNFLFVWMVTLDKLYMTFFAWILCLFISLLPLDIFCLISNVIVLIKNRKWYTGRFVLLIVAATLASVAVTFWLRILLTFYAGSHLPTV